MTKYIILNDTHCSIKNGNRNMAKYAERFFNFMFEYCKDNNINNILHLGDIMDNRKSIEFYAYAKFKEYFLDNLKKYNVNCDLMIGNHDVYYTNTNEKNSPSLLFGDHPNINIIVDNYKLIKDENILLIPWIYDNNKFINETLPDILSDINKNKLNINDISVFGHFEFSYFEVLPGVEMTHGLDSKLFKDFNHVYSGHFHTSSIKDNVFYLGSQMQFTWIDWNDPKYMHVFDSDKKTIERIEVPFVKFEKIFYPEDIKKQFTITDNYVKIISKKNDKDFKNFVSIIESKNPYDLKIQVLEDTIKKYDNIKLSDVSNPLKIITNIVENNKNSNSKILLDKLIETYNKAHLE